MKEINLTTLLILMTGGNHWHLVGLFRFDLVAALFGGQEAPLSRLVYTLVGLSVLWQMLPMPRASRVGDTRAQARH